MEAERTLTRARVLYAPLNDEAEADALEMGIGLIFMFPTLFLHDGSGGPQAAEYARIQGERTAIEKISVEKKVFNQVPPDHPSKEEGIR